MSSGGVLSNNPNERMEFQDRLTTPVLTALLVLCTIVTYSLSRGVFGATRFDAWLSSNCYNLPRVQPLLEAKNYVGLMGIGFFTNFASFDIIQMGFSLYFFWVFGKHVEQKLGPGRYLLLILLGMYVPLVALHWQMASSGNDTIYVGPLPLLCTFLGTYMVFPPLPKSKIGHGETIKKKEGIFRKAGRPDPLDKYIANPWMFVATFAVLQGLMWFWIHLDKKFWIFSGMPGYDTFSPLPCLIGAAIGWLMGYMLEQQATAALKISPMTLQAVKRYHELVDLDVGHEEALRGTARTLGLPYDKVKEWVAKNRGSMRIK
ncbi:MAG TPA: rhomboid family intramembrane serine protease [Trichormus sp.]|jgi:membrane associated rhomboid family serine protease